MRDALIILSIFSCFNCFAQKTGLAIINDSDGYVNVREASAANSKVITRLFNGAVFSCQGFGASDTDKWVDMVYEPEVESLDKKQRAYYANFIHKDSGRKKASCWIEGFIYGNRFTPFIKLPHIGTSLDYTSDVSDITVKNDSVILFVKETPFEPKKHVIKKSEDNNWIEKIDGKSGYGIIGELPKLELSSLKLTMKGKIVNIPDSAYNDMYDFRSHLYTSTVYFFKNGYVYITMLGSDGAGAYDVAWIIRNGKYIGRYIDTSND